MATEATGRRSSAERFRDSAPAGTHFGDLERAFSATVDRYGARLAIVLGNQAPEGKCPWHKAGMCRHCDIGGGEGTRFDSAENLARLEHFRTHPVHVLSSVAHLVVYNSGSVLNPVEMSSEVLTSVVNFARSLPSLVVISLDTRESFVKERRLSEILACVGDAITTRISIGLESANAHTRNTVLNKGMSESALRRAYNVLGEFCRAIGPRRIGLDVNVMVGGPALVGDDAVHDAVETARYLVGVSREFGLSVDVNVHPYYPSARGVAKMDATKRCSVETMAKAVVSMIQLVTSLGCEFGYYVGLEDEGHDQLPAERSAFLKSTRSAVACFNATQNAACLAAIVESK